MLGMVSGNTIHRIAAVRLTEIEAPQTVLVVPREVIHCRTVNELPKETLVAREETLAAPIVLVELGIAVVLVIAAELEIAGELETAATAVVLAIATALVIEMVLVIAEAPAIAVASAIAAVALAIVAELRTGVE
jgi:hypothetical protein